MLDNLISEFNKIREDFHAHCVPGKWYSVVYVVFFSHSFHMTLFYRIGKLFSLIPLVGVIFRYIFEYMMRIIFSSDISMKSDIGGGLKFEHGQDIVIGADVKVGKNLRIFNGVTIGGKDPALPSTGNQPTIGDNVVISTGSKILGPISLGNNVITGANCVCIKSVPDGSTVAGVPARIISK